MRPRSPAHPLLLVVALAAGLATCARARPAVAETAKEIIEARRLFSEALHDEEGKHFDVALEKFRRVQGVRDTIAIRYRIGACLEGLGRLHEASEAFAQVARGGTGAADDAEILR